MRTPARIAFLLSLLFLPILILATAARAQDWDPVTDEEKALQTDPLDPGSGAVVLFKRGIVEMEERGRLNWITRIRTYTRVKILTEAGREAADVSFTADKAYRLASVEGRTILPSGQIVPLDSNEVHRGVVYENGKHFAIMKTSFALPAVEPGAIIEYQTEEFVDLFFIHPWIFDTEGLSTLHSTLRVTTGERLELGQLPLQTSLNKITYTQTRVQLGNSPATQMDYEVSNLRPLREEPYSPPFYDRAVRLFFAPRRIVVSGQIFPVINEWDDVGE